MSKTEKHEKSVDDGDDLDIPASKNPSSVATFEENRLSTKARLDAQPKRSIRLRQASPGEPQLPDEVVGINGYNYLIQRGVEVKVPQTVYDILDEAHRI